MKLKRIIGSVTAVVALTAAGVLYVVHPAKSSDHQDTYNLAQQVGHNASADITDVYVFPKPGDSTRVVFAMNVWPLIPTGLGASKFFDPTILWQFKISHGTTLAEDQVIQIRATGTTAAQTLTLYGPAKPNEVGTANTLLATSQGSITYNNVGSFQNNTIKFYAGPRADPFVFDLLAFYSFLGDRNYGTHPAGQNDPGVFAASGGIGNGNNYPPVNGLAPAYDKTAARASAPSFNGFAAGTTSNGTNPTSPLGQYACSTNPASNTLAAYNVLSLVVEVPKTLLETGYSSTNIHVWATTSSSTVKS